MTIPNEELNAKTAIIEVFGNIVVAVYLYGLAVAGGLQKSSDVDVFAVVSDRPPSAQLRTKFQK